MQARAARLSSAPDSVLMTRQVPCPCSRICCVRPQGRPWSRRGAVREVQCCGVLDCPGLDSLLLRRECKQLSAVGKAFGGTEALAAIVTVEMVPQGEAAEAVPVPSLRAGAVQVQCRCRVSHGFSWSLCFARTSVRPWWKTHCPATWMHCNETMLPTMLPDCLRREVKCPR